MSEPTYQPVLPKEHEADCNLRRYRETGQTRYLNAWNPPAEGCERCANLWERIGGGSGE